MVGSLFMGCDESVMATLPDVDDSYSIECSENDGIIECECPEGYFVQENGDGNLECYLCEDDNCN